MLIGVVFRTLLSELWTRKRPTSQDCFWSWIRQKNSTPWPSGRFRELRFKLDQTKGVVLHVIQVGSGSCGSSWTRQRSSNFWHSGRFRELPVKLDQTKK
jgi:hypothetical protein